MVRTTIAPGNNSSIRVAMFIAVVPMRAPALVNARERTRNGREAAMVSRLPR
jgi:hypothetical protein